MHRSKSQVMRISYPICSGRFLKYASQMLPIKKTKNTHTDKMEKGSKVKVISTIK